MISLRPVRLQRIKIWLNNRNDFEALMKALESFGKFHLSIVSHLPSSFEETFFIAGWIPARSNKEFMEIVAKTTGGRCRVRVEEPKMGEDVPTLQNHNEILKPFEKIVNSFGIPSYWEVDPTFFVAFSFALIFGFMFADIGHGFILTLVGITVFILHNKFKLRVRGILSYVFDNGSLLIICGLSGILGGLLFSELFGYHIHLPIPEFTIPDPIRLSLPFRPLEKPMSMFKLSLLIGAIHISMGLILNFFNRLLRREFRKMIYEPVCWLWLYWGLLYLVFSFKLNFEAWMKSPIFLWCLALPSALMFMGKLTTERLDGIISFIEALISTVSNTISYLRIMALSLVHSVMSQMIISISGGHPVVVFIGALAVIALEGLIIFIQTTRLVWVEWFSKFYKGDGRVFKPISLKEINVIMVKHIYRDVSLR
jgi:V/A-type H+-transporting ATPase subunit I